MDIFWDSPLSLGMCDFLALCVVFGKMDCSLWVRQFFKSVAVQVIIVLRISKVELTPWCVMCVICAIYAVCAVCGCTVLCIVFTGFCKRSLKIVRDLGMSKFFYLSLLFQ